MNRLSYEAAKRRIRGVRVLIVQRPAVDRSFGRVTLTVADLDCAARPSWWVRFASRHGDDLVLWALFERTHDTSTSAHLHQRTTEPLHADDPELVQALHAHRLNWPIERAGLGSGHGHESHHKSCHRSCHNRAPRRLQSDGTQRESVRSTHVRLQQGDDQRCSGRRPKALNLIV